MFKVDIMTDLTEIRQYDINVPVKYRHQYRKVILRIVF